MASSKEVETLCEGFEYSIHACPRKYRTEVSALFPLLSKDSSSNGEHDYTSNDPSLDALFVVPTCQHAKTDLVKMGDDVEQEKDYCLEKFFAFAKDVCNKLSEKKYWCDYIDPCSGHPMIHQDTHMVYNEVDALSTLLGYSVQNAGCCKVVFHPIWGSQVYPSTLFAIAPKEELQEIIQSAKHVVDKFEME